MTDLALFLVGIITIAITLAALAGIVARVESLRRRLERLENGRKL